MRPIASGWNSACACWSGSRPTRASASPTRSSACATSGRTERQGAGRNELMSNGQLTAVLIVAIVMVAGVLRAWLGAGGHGRRGRYGRDEALPRRDDGETLRLREEGKMLKERLPRGRRRRDD